MSRELRTRARARIQPGESDESDESEDADGPAQIPSTSIQDLINPADAQQFDQTFSDADANLNIEGAFDPVAGPKQVIPRIAYVLNFNLVYNEQQERWEPDTGNESGSADVAVSVLEQTSNQSFATNGTFDPIQYQQTGVDTLGAANVSADQIDISEAGTYRLTLAQKLFNHDAGCDIDLKVRVNGADVLAFDGQGRQNASAGGQSLHVSKPVELAAGDTVASGININNSAQATGRGKPQQSFLSVTRLA